MTAFAKPDNILAMPIKSNEWYTPHRYIEAARTVMNGIELDPASSREANLIVRAERFYTIQDNGLEQEWKAKSVWLNPPYGLDKSKPNNQRSTIKMWVDRLLQEYQTNNVHQAIALVTTQMNARWFFQLWQFPICFPDGNIRFRIIEPTSYRPGRMTDSHTYGNCFIYLGPHEQKFIEVFSEFGPVIPANAAVRRQQITPLSLWEVAP